MHNSRLLFLARALAATQRTQSFTEGYLHKPEMPFLDRKDCVPSFVGCTNWMTSFETIIKGAATSERSGWISQYTANKLQDPF